MLETEIKKLTEALIENARLLQAHIAIRKDNNPDGTAKCCKKTAEPEPEASEGQEEEPDATKELIDKANAREEKKREAKAAKKAEAAAAAKEKEEAEANEPDPDGEGKVTAEEVREYIISTRKKLKEEDGPKAATQHRKDTKELLKDGGYSSLSSIPEDELADFFEDVKGLAE